MTVTDAISSTLLVLLLNILHISLSESVATISRFHSLLGTTTNVTVTCSAFCDKNGLEQPAQECQGNQFCCGHEYDKFCCEDPGQAIFPDFDPPQNGCNRSVSWWYYQWRLIIGMLCILMTGLLIMVTYFCIKHYGCCCCKNCKGNQNEDAPQLELSDQGLSRGLGINGQEGGIVSPVFEPPSYEEATVEPPKYSELYDNLELVSEVESVPSTPMHTDFICDLPIYSRIHDVIESRESLPNINDSTVNRGTVLNLNATAADAIEVLNLNINSDRLLLAESIANAECGISNPGFIFGETSIDVNTQNQVVSNTNMPTDNVNDTNSNKAGECQITFNIDQLDSCQSSQPASGHLTHDIRMTSSEDTLAEQNRTVRLSPPSESYNC